MNTSNSQNNIQETNTMDQAMKSGFQMPESIKQRLDQRLNSSRGNKTERSKEEKLNTAQQIIKTRKVRAKQHNERVEQIMKNKTLSYDIMRKFSKDVGTVEGENNELLDTQAWNELAKQEIKKRNLQLKLERAANIRDQKIKTRQQTALDSQRKHFFNVDERKDQEIEAKRLLQ